jgi:DNA repair protein RadA/Sms
MSNKVFTVYSCSNCGAQFPKWSGRCLSCGKWGTLQMQTIGVNEVSSKKTKFPPAEFIDFDSFKTDELPRIKTGIGEFDRVMGGGIMPGSLILLSGEPGIGKSTLVGQIADAVQKTHEALYVSGEESAFQVKSRFDRLGIMPKKIGFLNEVHLEKVLASIDQRKPGLVIIDSIQTIYSAEVEAEPGNISQIRTCAAKLLEMAKHDNIAVVLIGHITKDGSVAGPKSLEHIVDTVVYLEIEKNNDFRILRATKNRFGSVNEIGIFTMTSSGFEQVKNPSSIFLDTREEKLSGSVISCLMEGTRPFMVETQALVTKTVFGYPQRKSSGFDLNRLQILAAVLTKRANINLSNQDIILNVVGGFKIDDPGLDLAVCLAITSSLLNQVVDRKTIVLGEVGLGGEIRNIKNLEQRLNEAEKLGFTKAIVPETPVKIKKISLIPIKKVSEAIKLLI